LNYALQTQQKRQRKGRHQRREFHLRVYEVIQCNWTM